MILFTQVLAQMFSVTTLAWTMLRSMFVNVSVQHRKYSRSSSGAPRMNLMQTWVTTCSSPSLSADTRFSVVLTTKVSVSV